MSTSREQVRDQLVTLLSAALVGTGLPCKTVTGSKVDALTGLTPLVAVLSAGSEREPLTFRGDTPTFYLEVQVWVMQKTDTWTNAQAEDALDTIESIIASVYESNQFEYAARTAVMEVAVSGVAYYLERIQTVVRLAYS